MDELEYNRRYRAEHREALAAKDRERYLRQREERIARQKIRTTVYRREERAERERNRVVCLPTQRVKTPYTQK